jgi:hypothetical protein
LIPENYGMKSYISSYFEEKLINGLKSEGENFCSYELLNDESEENLYMHVLCQEFFPKRKELSCPTAETQDQCEKHFSVDNNQGDFSKCDTDCKITQLKKPYLKESAGTSVPTILKNKGKAISHWIPRDGSFYNIDLKNNFPEPYRKALNSISTGKLSSINLDRAESYFSMNAKYEIAEIQEQSCKKTTDCPDMPFEYLLKSNCHYKTHCIKNKCSIICPDYH